jgi:hypothetical protein
VYRGSDAYKGEILIEESGATPGTDHFSATLYDFPGSLTRFYKICGVFFGNIAPRVRVIYRSRGKI